MIRRARSLVAVLASTALLLVTTGCLADNPAGGSSDDDGVLALSSVEYVLRWERGDAVVESGGLAFVTDQGTRIRLERAYLVTYAVQLAACTESDGITTARWRPTLLERTAWAGHGEGWEPSAFTTPKVENLLDDTEVSLGTVGFAPAAQCQTHYLVGPAPAELTTDLPTDVDMVDRSLVIEGRFSVAGADDWQPLSISTALAWGALEPSDILQSPGDVHATVVIERRLDTLFDGIALEDPNTDLPFEVLQNLGDQIIFDVIR